MKSDAPKVWRIYRRGEQPWDDAQWGGAMFDEYPYVATTKHVAGIHPGCVFEFDYYYTLEEAVSDMRDRVMKYPWRQGEVLELPIGWR